MRQRYSPEYRTLILFVVVLAVGVLYLAHRHRYPASTFDAAQQALSKNFAIDEQRDVPGGRVVLFDMWHSGALSDFGYAFVERVDDGWKPLDFIGPITRWAPITSPHRAVTAAVIQSAGPAGHEYIGVAGWKLEKAVTMIEAVFPEGHIYRATPDFEGRFLMLVPDTAPPTRIRVLGQAGIVMDQYTPEGIGQG